MRGLSVLVACAGTATIVHADPRPDDAGRAVAIDSKPADKPAGKPAGKPADKPAVATKPDPLAAVKAEPNEFTNDPVLGKAARVMGTEVTGMVAFTFDDGPNPETTPAVLDALDKYGVPATFFIVTRRLVGKHGDKPRELVQRMVSSGHLVASHSVSHPYLGKATAKKLDAELDPSFKTLATEAKRPIGLYRAPFGAINDAGRARLKKLGVTEVFWSIDTLDWKATDAAKLRKKTVDMIVRQNGGVVLLHDVKQITAKVTPQILDDLEAENCKRLADGKDPIVPVSLHYFLRDGKTPRPVPADVQNKTDAYKKALPERCFKRKAAQPSKAVGDFSRCFDNPLAKGCQ
jgi:peptidoglycan/xylan/chitin deacetylase (PgdA/CDA1 family)